VNAACSAAVVGARVVAEAADGNKVDTGAATEEDEPDRGSREDCEERTGTWGTAAFWLPSLHRIAKTTSMTITANNRVKTITHVRCLFHSD
jgi:hypothetical protein